MIIYIIYAKQKHLGCKKVRGQEEAALWMNQRLKALISSKAKKFSWLFMKNPFTLMTHNSSQGIFTTMIGFVTWAPTKRWPSNKANHGCENTLWTIVCH